MTRSKKEAEIFESLCQCMTWSNTKHWIHTHKMASNHFPMWPVCYLIFNWDLLEDSHGFFIAKNVAEYYSLKAELLIWPTLVNGKKKNQLQVIELTVFSLWKTSFSLSKDFTPAINAHLNRCFCGASLLGLAGISHFFFVSARIYS